jgi:hypothetical protein
VRRLATAAVSLLALAALAPASAMAARTVAQAGDVFNDQSVIAAFSGAPGGAVTIRRGRTARVTLTLPRSVQRRLAVRGRLRVTAVARTTQPRGGGRPRTTRRSILLRAVVR